MSGGQSVQVVHFSSAFYIKMLTRRGDQPLKDAEDVGGLDDATVLPEETQARTHLLVELRNATEPAEKERFAARGLNLLEPLEKRLWYASVATADIEIVRALDGVLRVDFVEPGDKLAERLRTGAEPFPYQLRPSDRIAYSVLFHRDVTADEVQGLGQRMDVIFENFDANSLGIVRALTVNVPKDGLQTLSELDIVSWIEPAPPPDEDHNSFAQTLSNVDVAQLSPFNLDGSGVTVGVWEAGAVVYAAHLDLQGRVILETGQTTSFGDHATHVAGTIGASGANVPLAEGMAPQVTMASWDSLGDVNEMSNAATSTGGVDEPTPIQISNHSYGIGIGWNGEADEFTDNQDDFGQYNATSLNYDNIVVDTGLIVVKSAGNHRNDVPANTVPLQPGDCLQGGLAIAADCIGPKGSAKNVITVGAMDGATEIGSFSSYGPTNDGRIKPDLMAHGVGVFSLASSNNTDTTTKNGTSMAAPVVSGVAALVLQEANTLDIAVSPAAMKALLIQTAQDVEGIDQSTEGPDYATGWGIVDAQAAVELLQQGGLVQNELGATGVINAWTQTIYVPAGQTEIHLTLAWDDPPPALWAATQTLVNDLDLRLIAPNATQFTPWILGGMANPGLPAVRDGGNDDVNNVEQVSVLNPMAGTWTVQVSANPGNLPQGPQSFAVAGVTPPIDCGPVSVGAPRNFQASDGTFMDRVSLSWIGPFAWQTAINQSGGSDGAFGSLAIANDDTLHAVYRRQLPGGGQLMHGWKSPGGCWESEVADGEENVGMFTDLAIDADDTLHASYFDSAANQIKYAWKSPSGTWNTEVVSSDPKSSLQSTSLSVEASGVVHILYPGASGLRHAWKASSSSTWQLETVAPMHQFVAAALGANNTVHAVFETASTGGLTHAWKPQNGSWQLEVIDSGQVGSNVSVAFKSATFGFMLHVSYHDWGNQRLMHAWKQASSTSGSWNVEVVDESANVEWFSSVAVGAFPTSHTVQISYYDVDTAALKFAWKNFTTGEWNTDILDFTGTTGQWTSLAIDANQLPQVIYNDLSGTSLNHAFLAPDVAFTVYRRDTVDGVGTGLPFAVIGTVQSSGYFQTSTYDDTSTVQNTLYEYGVIATYGTAIGWNAADTGFASSWTVETIDNSANDVGKFASMAYNGGEEFHISYFDDTDNDLLYRLYSTTGPGLTELVTPSSNAANMDIALSPLDHKHISYQLPGSDLGHAWEPPSGGGWTLSVPDGVDTVGQFSSIAVGKDGVPHIAYYDATNNHLKHAWGTLTGSQWTWADEVVDSEGNTGQYTSIAVASDGSLHISYYSPSGLGKLKHAWGTWDAANAVWQWAIVEIRSGSSAGKYSSLALDSDGNPHIVYTRGNFWEHAWATWDAAADQWDWETEQVDYLGPSGGHTSMDIDGDNNIHVSYYLSTNTNNALKYALGEEDSGGGSWTWYPQVVDGLVGEDVGQYSSIQVHDSGSVYIAYYDAMNKSLKLAHN